MPEIDRRNADFRHPIAVPKRITDAVYQTKRIVSYRTAACDAETHASAERLRLDGPHEHAAEFLPDEN